MFDIVCSTCTRRQLIFPSQVLGVANDGHGIHVTYRCWCGSAQVWTTGRADSAATTPAAA